ncbi:MAG: PQQ-dependent sugar dehydrogenase [Planctomycetota bacterium]
MRQFTSSFFVLMVVLLSFSGLSAQNVPNGFAVEEVVSTGLSLPTDFALLDDGRAIIIEKAGGDIKFWVPSLGDAATIVGNIVGVDAAGERGLLSCAVDPDFSNNGYLYIWGARIGSPGLELLRFECAGDLSDGNSSDLVMVPATEFLVLSAIPDNQSLHNGGALRFGPDGMLYLSMGDDQERERAQDSSSLQGCVLRLDVAGLPAGPGSALREDLDPGDNPYSDSGLIDERLLIAYGLRNPFSFVIDPNTGDLFVGDVGEAQRDELDHLARDSSGQFPGVNFGWPWREGRIAGTGVTGATQPGDLVEPIDDRVHGSESFAIMAAGVYRNQGGPFDWGMSYENSVFHSDFVLGTMERLTFDAASGAWVTALPVVGQPTIGHWGTGFTGYIHYTQSSDGAVYCVNFLAGRLSRIVALVSTSELDWVGGMNQVGVDGKTFGEPFAFEVRDLSGIPLAGQIVEASPSVNAVIVGPSSKMTDVNGRVDFQLQAIAAGEVSLNAALSGPSNTNAIATAFARGLEVTYLPTAAVDFLVVNFVNTSFGGSPVPFIFVAVPPTEATTTSLFGEIAFDLLSPGATVIIEDPAGFFFLTQIEGGFGNPGRTNIYQVPAGVLQGVLKFQVLYVDLSTPSSVDGVTPSAVAPSNIVTLTF